MVSEIRIYIEGGGDGAYGKAQIRQGFSEFFRDTKALARRKRIGWLIIACGSRNATFDSFQRALKTHPDAFNVLLVDSEGPVDARHPLWQHLQARDGWLKPHDCSDEQCHLMVQAMEAWFVADLDALRRYYGRDLNESALPRHPRVEEIDRHRLADALDAATRHTNKRHYNKIEHARDLLRDIDAAKVRNAAPYCERLFEVLNRKIDE